jgi:hypothetical protein
MTSSPHVSGVEVREESRDGDEQLPETSLADGVTR